MKLAEMVTAVQGSMGSRFQNSITLVLQYLDTVQKVAFNRDMRAFMWWQNYLTIYTDVVLSTSGTAFAASDVGKVLSCATATGTIISYNGRTFQVSILTGTTFSGAVTVLSGSGAGTFVSQAISKGPYSWNGIVPLLGSLTPFTSFAGVRRMLGVTTATDSQLYGETNIALIQDYNFAFGEFDKRAIFEIVRKYDIQKALFFIDTPISTTNTYRWVYYIRPPTINIAAYNSETPEVNILIPEEFHQTVLVEGAQALADRSTYGDKTPEQVLAQIIQPFWDMMAQAYTPDGANNNMTSEGQL